MNRTVLLTGTRAPATLDLARRLCRDGVRVIGADSMRFPLGRFSRAFARHQFVPPPRQDGDAFLASVADLAEREKVDLIWPTCEEVLHVAKGRSMLEMIAPVFSPPLGVLDLLHHKLRFAEWTRSLGGAVVAPESRDARDVHSDDRWIWKPNYSRFAVHSRTFPPANTDGWMAQRLVEGSEFSAWALCVDGQVRVLTQYTCPARTGRGAGCSFEPFWSMEAASFLADAARSLGYTGSIAFDFMRSDSTGETVVLECNPRLTSGVHVLAPDLSISGLLFDRPADLPPPQQSAQLFLPTLFSSPRFAGFAPDVLNNAADRAPAWGQLLSLAELVWRAATKRLSLLEASTWDIEYDGL